MRAEENGNPCPSSGGLIPKIFASIFRLVRQSLGDGGVLLISTLAERSNNFREKNKVEREISFQYCFENKFGVCRIEGARCQMSKYKKIKMTT